MKAYETLEAALTHTKNLGIRITRGALFDWRDPRDPFQPGSLPSACNAIGAVLLYSGKQDLFRDGFPEGWLDLFCTAIGENHAWVWRFCHGWDRGNCLTFDVVEKGKEKTIVDEDSRAANKLASRWVNGGAKA